jgi:hypothetical protein
MRQYQLARSIEVGLRPETRRERNLILLRQDRNLGHAIDVRIEASHGPGEYQSSLLSD